MRIKVLKLGESAKEVDVPEGATVEQAIAKANFDREGMSMTLNGHADFDTATVREGDIITMSPNVKGGR